MAKIKLFAAILAASWIASFLFVLSKNPSGGHISAVLVGAEAFPVALIASLVGWFLTRNVTEKIPYITGTCWAFIVVGILGVGDTYGYLRDRGHSAEEANLLAFFGIQGFILLVGAAELIRRRISSKRDDV